MNIKIAAFGQEETVHKIISYTNEREGVEIVPFVFSEAKETADLIEQAFMCDIYLFGGPLPYFYAKDVIDRKRLPAVQVDFDAYMILNALYHVRNTYNHYLSQISIDISHKKHIDDVLTEMDICNDNIYTYHYGDSDSVDIRQIISYHEDLWNTGKISHVLTSLEEVERVLSQKGIPVSCMCIPKLNIEHAIDRATSIATINQSKSAQIVAGYIRIKDFDAIKSEHGDFYVQELRLKLHQILLKYSRKTYASVLANGNDQFVLFGTRGILDHITNHYRDFPLLNEMETALNCSVDIGFGLGLTARQAEENAGLALDTCGYTEGGTCYIINERQETIGPLGIAKEFNPSALYRSLIHEAKLNNELSYNFIEFIEVRNNEPFSSNDVAVYYRVTKRSAERTIKKLLAGSVIKAVGEEKPYVRGRPRKLFQLNQ